VSAGVQAIPPNPQLLILDTDVLVQVLLANEFRPLRELKRCYNIQPSIVEAVEMETRSPGRSLKKHLSTLEPRLHKALGNGTLLLLDGRSFPSIVGASAHAIETQISITGTRYHRVADYGEAYSHATAAILGLPLMSHDFTAVRALKRAREPITPYMFRAFDLYAFSHQCGVLTVKDCDNVRQLLYGHHEWLPDAFFKRNFADGLGMFYPRLLDRSLGAIGSSVPIDPDDTRLLVSSQSVAPVTETPAGLKGPEQ
jgi:hypothetical protein